MFGKDDTRETKVFMQSNLKNIKMVPEWPGSLRWYLAERQPYAPGLGKGCKVWKALVWPIYADHRIGIGYTDIHSLERVEKILQPPMNSFWKDLQDMCCVPGVGVQLGSLHGPIAVSSQSSRAMRMWGLEGWSPGLEWALSAPLGWRVIRAARLSADMGSEGSPLVVNWSFYGFSLPFKWLSGPKEIQLYCRRQ